MRRQPGEKPTLGLLRTVEPLTTAAAPVFAVEEIVHPAFFREMGISSLAGRLCDAARPEDGQPVDVINQAMARRYWPNGDALGKHLRGYGGIAKIIGIVPAMPNSLLDATPAPQVFVCFPIQGMHVLIRHSGKIRALEKELPPLVRRLDPDAAVDDTSSRSTTSSIGRSVPQKSWPLSLTLSERCPSRLPPQAFSQYPPR